MAAPPGGTPTPAVRPPGIGAPPTEPPTMPHETAPATPSAPPVAEAAPMEIKPKIDVSKTYREIGTIRIMAIIFMIITAIMSIISGMAGSTAEGDIGSYIKSYGHLLAGSVIFAVVAIILGFMAVFRASDARQHGWFILGSVVFMIAAAACRPSIMEIGTLTEKKMMAEFLLAIIYGVFFLLYLEYVHAVRRFWEIGEMAIEKNLKDFDYGHVLRQYIVKSFIYTGIIIGVSMIVVGIHAGFVGMKDYPQFSKSIEMNSIYGLAIVEGMFFLILGIIITLVLGREEYAKSIKTGMAITKTKMIEASKRRKTEEPAGESLIPEEALSQKPTGLSPTAPPPRAQ